jgi:hypothetical protein
MAGRPGRPEPEELRPLAVPHARALRTCKHGKQQTAHSAVSCSMSILYPDCPITNHQDCGSSRCRKCSSNNINVPLMFPKFQCDRAPMPHRVKMSALAKAAPCGACLLPTLHLCHAGSHPTYSLFTSLLAHTLTVAISTGGNLLGSGSNRS